VLLLVRKRRRDHDDFSYLSFRSSSTSAHLRLPFKSRKYVKTRQKFRERHTP
jgi:hypothetical protein